MEETQRQNLVMSFNNVLRTSALVGVVDLQRAALAFSALIERTPPGKNLPLGPLYDFLLEQKAPEAPVREVLVFLKSREERFGITMDLPPKLASLSIEERNKLVVAFTQRGASSGTSSGTPSSKSVDLSSSRPTKKPSSPGNDVDANATVAAPTAAPAAPSTTTPAQPKKADFDTGPQMSSTRKLAMIAAALAVLLVVNLVFSAVTAPVPPKPLELNDPAGLPCSDTKGTGQTIVCRVPKSFADKTPKPVVDAKGAVTAAAAKALGYNRVMVFSIEDSTLRWVFY